MRFEAARDLAQTRGFAYLPASQVAKRPALLQNSRLIGLPLADPYGQASRMTRPEAARSLTTTRKSCNDALKRRGSLLIWRDKDMTWLAPKAGRNGRPLLSSDAAIQ